MYCSKYITYGLTGFAAMLSISAAQAAVLPAVQQAGEIIYVSGGIGDEERDALRAVKRDYNLRITSADISGAFTGDTHIVICDSAGRPLLNTNAGPIFYARLPDGYYLIEASGEGQSKKQSVTIDSGNTVLLSFSWEQEHRIASN